MAGEKAIAIHRAWEKWPEADVELVADLVAHGWVAAKADLPDRVAVAEVIDREHMRLHGSSSGDFGVYLRIADAVLALLHGEGQK